MSDPNPRERQKVWARALADATKYALYLTRNRARAEELAAEALAAALDPARSPWDPASGRTLSQRVVYLVRQALSGQTKKKRVRDDPVRAAAVDATMRRGMPRPDAAVLERQRQARGEDRMRQVRENLDALAQSVLALLGEGLAPAEQAKRLGIDVGKIYEARRRIAERIRALPAADDSDQDGGARDAYLCAGDEEDSDDDAVSGRSEVDR